MNYIYNIMNTLNNRPTNGAFTFNGQGTGLSLADFMLGIVSGGMIQGNPVFDNDHSEYVGAYAQEMAALGQPLPKPVATTETIRAA